MFVINRMTRGVYSRILRTKNLSVVTNTVKVANDGANDSQNVQKKSKTSSLVAAAFESLKSDESAEGDNIVTKESTTKNFSNSMDEKILNAKTVSGLLSITDSDNGTISRKHALKVVSILAEWSSINRVKLSEFENDARFIKLCRVLGRAVPKNNNSNANANNNNNSNNNKKQTGFRTEDLNTVLGIAGDDEAAKLVGSISIPQMVKVMSTLSQKKRRSTPLLRSLAFNISSNSEQLDLKQCGDLLYAMASLNFPDSVLTAKICADIQANLPKNKDKPAVIGSILTSLGLLKYRDLDVLESLTDWILQNNEVCRPQDLSAFFLTMATLNFKSANIDQIKTKLINTLVQADFPKSLDWLNQVWALSLLGLADVEHISSVLSPEFINNLSSDKIGLTPTIKMKLLNIHSFAKMLMHNYKGPFLPADSPVFSVPLTHNKSKQVLVNGMLDALKSLLHSDNYVQTLVDTKMGFVVDAQFVLDSKRNPLPLDKEHTDAKKVAILVIDFHDMCHGTHRSITGVTNLSLELLEKAGYNVLPVPYNEFNTSDKLLKRVQYVEDKLKSIVKTQK